MRSFKEIFKLPLLTVSIIVLNGCSTATTQSKIYEPEEIGGFKAWKFSFKYDRATTREERLKSTGVSETRVTHRNRSILDLQLRDDLFFILRDRYKIPVVKDSPNAGVISIQTGRYYTVGEFSRITVTLENNSGDTLSRLIIENGDSNNSMKDGNEFAKYAARQIARAIQKGVKAWRRAEKDRPQQFFPGK